MGLIVVAPCGTPQVVTVEKPVSLLPLVSSIPKVVGAGIRGPRGVGAGGITYIQDHEPVGAQESETWWNPLTLQLKVRHNNEFEPVSPDGGHF